VANCAFATAANRPNIILFLVDDYDKPETSVYGGNVLTPNLDRLAREGMTFHNAHVTSTVCTPSRYTFLTGRYAGASTFPTYIETFGTENQGLPGFNMGLEDDNMNVGAVLSDHGYTTGFVGKYHVGHDYEKGEGEDAVIRPIGKKSPYTDELNEQYDINEKRYRELIKERGFTWAKNIYWNNFKQPFHGHNPEWTIQAALEFVDLHHDQPFYLHYSTTLLHGTNKEWDRSLREKALTTGEGILDQPLQVMPPRDSVLERNQAAGLSREEVGYLWMDDSLGMLLDKLDELGIAENTVVVFVSDHGSNKKGSLFKSRGTEVPCLVRWPAVIDGGTKSHELLQNTDFVPTWFDLADAKLPDDYLLHGVSLLPLFKDPTQTVREFVYGEMGAARSVKTKQWNYISLRYTADQISDFNSRKNRSLKPLLGLSGGISRSARFHPSAFDLDQLYSLNVDPDEQNNLAEEEANKGQLVAMQTLLRKELQRLKRPYGEFVVGGNAASREASLPLKAALKKQGN
jgi:arylsulfatase A-like enzyme